VYQLLKDGDEMKKPITILFAVIALAGAAGPAAGSHVPEWTDFNESDPGVTFARGIDVAAAFGISTRRR
jgi:hypothetical protein